MGVIHAVDLYPKRDPLSQDSKYLLVDALRVIVKVDRVNVLVFLWRILGICNRPVCTGGEPLWAALHPWVIWRCLQCKVHGNFDTQLVGSLYEIFEVLFATEIRMDGVMSTCRIADCPG